jgi:hypothetical protein
MGKVFSDFFTAPSVKFCHQRLTICATFIPPLMPKTIVFAMLPGIITLKVYQHPILQASNYERRTSA